MSARRQRLHIVVTCTNRKRRPVPSGLQLRQATGARTSTRMANWTRRLTTSDVDAIPAHGLYAGEHWAIAHTLPTLASANFAHPTLWVVSAGWGLIPVDASIRPYSATFTPHHPDSVPDGAMGARDWWTAMATWAGPAAGTPRSVAALVADHPRDRILVVLSQRYFAACREDLSAAVRSAKAGELSIIAAGVDDRAWANDDSALSDLARACLPGNARLQHRLGGSLGSLNARIAAHMLRSGLTDHDAMTRHLTRLLAKAPALPTYERRRLTDTEVVAYIHRRQAVDAGVSRHQLLRDLRTDGLACEQSRFADLFAAAAAARTVPVAEPAGQGPNRLKTVTPCTVPVPVSWDD